MNRLELVDAIAKETKMTKKDVTVMVDAFVKVVKESVSKKDKVTLIGFGSFEAKKRAARDARNPKTGETVHVAEKTVPVFVAGKAFKEQVNA